MGPIKYWHELSAYTKRVTTIAAMVTAVLASGTAWVHSGLFVPASREYVHEYVRPIQYAQSSTSVAVDRLLQSQLQREQLELRRDPVALANTAAQLRLQQIENSLDSVSKRINEAERVGIK